jgi:hypothetical protein
MLKPSEMGLAGARVTISAHRGKVESKLESMAKSGSKKNVALVCMDALNASSGEMIDLRNIKSTEINEIKNYFAEVGGPIWCQEQGLIAGLRRSDYTYYSNSQTEGMYDFKVWRKTEEILVSNKQIKGGTNTLKPGDVVSLVNNDANLSKKWRNTKQFKVFQILDTSSVTTGPIKAVQKHYYRKVDVPVTDYHVILNQMTQNDIVIADVPKSFMKMIRENEYTLSRLEEKKEVRGTMINFLFEKILVDESYNDPKYDELFKDVTKNNILFFKFDLSSRGVVSYLISDPNKSKNPAGLRSKNGVERRRSSGSLNLDKLGFQP